jgi:hypothetical protein
MEEFQTTSFISVFVFTKNISRAKSERELLAMLPIFFSKLTKSFKAIKRFQQDETIY